MAGLDAFSFPEVAESPRRTISEEEERTCAAMEALEMRSFELQSNRQFKKWNGILDYFLGPDDATSSEEQKPSVEEPVDMEAQELNERLLRDVMEEIDVKDKEDQFHSLGLHAYPNDNQEDSDDNSDFSSVKDESEISEEFGAEDVGEARSDDEQVSGKPKDVVKSKTNNGSLRINDNWNKKANNNNTGEVVNDSWQKVDVHVPEAEAGSSKSETGLVIGAQIAMTTAINKGLCKVAEMISNIQLPK